MAGQKRRGQRQPTRLGPGAEGGWTRLRSYSEAVRRALLSVPPKAHRRRDPIFKVSRWCPGDCVRDGEGDPRPSSGPGGGACETAPPGLSEAFGQDAHDLQREQAPRGQLQHVWVNLLQSGEYANHVTVKLSLIGGDAVSWQAAPSGSAHCVRYRTGHTPAQVYLTLKEEDR